MQSVPISSCCCIRLKQGTACAGAFSWRYSSPMSCLHRRKQIDRSDLVVERFRTNTDSARWTRWHDSFIPCTQPQREGRKVSVGSNLPVCRQRLPPSRMSSGSPTQSPHHKIWRKYLQADFWPGIGSGCHITREESPGMGSRGRGADAEWISLIQALRDQARTPNH